MNKKDFLSKFRMTPDERRSRDKAIDQDAFLAAESEKPLVESIRKKGWLIESVWDLVNFHTDHASLENLLLKALTEEYHPKIKMAICRSLVSAGISSEKCSQIVLGELYKSLTQNGYLVEAVQQSLAHALAKLAHPVIAEELQKLTYRCKGTFLEEDLEEACRKVTVGGSGKCKS